MVEMPAMNAGVFIPLVAVVGGVPLHLAMFAIGLCFLVQLLFVVIVHFQIFKLRRDTLEKGQFALAFVIFGFRAGSKVSQVTSMLFEATFHLGFNNANELLRAHVLERITSGVALDFSNVSLSEIVPGGR